jgi:hypothetical protein
VEGRETAEIATGTDIREAASTKSEAEVDTEMGETTTE